MINMNDETEEMTTEQVADQTVETQETEVTETETESAASEPEKTEPAVEDKPKKRTSRKSKKAEESETVENATPQEASQDKPTEEPKTASEEKTEDKPKEKKKFKISRPDFSASYEKLSSSIPALVMVCISAFIFMLLVCFAVFFVSVKGEEQVLVPNVIGKNWDEALLELQAKELYAKVNLRYSDVPGDAGQILDQSPSAGAIVKGYSRVNLVISRGVIIDSVGGYVGRNFSEVQMELQTIFAGQTKPLIILETPEYKPDLAEAGTILLQDPAEGFSISEPVKLHLVVSRGPTFENTHRPYVIGQDIKTMLNTMANSKIIFDITSHEAREDEKPGTVVSQEMIEDEYIPNYSRVAVEMAMPPESNNDTISGLYQCKLDEYPYTVSMRLEAVPTEGAAYNIIDFEHPGGNFTVPYTVTRGTTLVLYVANKVKSRTVIE